MVKTYSFAAERFDRLANCYFDYTIILYVTQQGPETEVIETKSKRRFAARCRTKLNVGNFFTGATIVINSFQFHIVDYNDSATRDALAHLHETTLAIVHGSSLSSLGKIITAISGFGFTITKLQTVTVTRPTQNILSNAGITIPTGPAAFLVLLRPDAVQQWQKLRSRFDNPDEVFGSASVEAAREEIDHIFSSDIIQQTSALTNKNSSLCLIKSHAVAAGNAGAIIQQLSDHLNVTAVEQVHLSKEDALEFLTCYRGVLPQFGSQVEAIYAAPSIAVEVNDAAEDVDVVGALRQIAGPYDVTCAKCLAPDSIRARFGVDNVHNAVHVTDLPTDGKIETNFFFRVLKT